MVRAVRESWSVSRCEYVVSAVGESLSVSRCDCVVSAAGEELLHSSVHPSVNSLLPVFERLQLAVLFSYAKHVELLIRLCMQSGSFSLF